MIIKFIHNYDHIIRLENLLEAWEEFSRGKRNRQDVQEFQLNLISNILVLHQELKQKTYYHSPYQHFKISDPKPRDIHKATVRDRLIHHAICKILLPYFDRHFIYDSYSCRKNKGTHRAILRFAKLSRKASVNNQRTLWILKCDVRKFFASIDQEILLIILKKYIVDTDIVWLLERIVSSFNNGTIGKSLPLGNLTSQLLVNIYMNEFDQFAKHKLKARHYVRYADDFAVMSTNREYLEDVLIQMTRFLSENLKLELHPDKVFIKTLASGVDFLGWIHFPGHRVLRIVTKRRMLKKIKSDPRDEVVCSYLGMVGWGNGWKLQQKIKKLKTKNF